MTEEFTAETPFGTMTVTADRVRIAATEEQLRAWGDATQKDTNAPRSLHRQQSIQAVANGNGLCDLAVVAASDIPDVGSLELHEWLCAVAKPTLPTTHPAWFPLVGQWQGEL